MDTTTILMPGGRLRVDDFGNLLIEVVERRGDYDAQIAACRLTTRRFHAMIGQYGAGTSSAAAEVLMTRAERRMARAIAAVPDGAFAFEDTIDDDGMGTFHVPIRVKIEVSGERMTVDFRGSARQIRGNMNCPRPATISATVYAVMAMIDSGVACNEGLLRAIEVVTEPGSVVDLVFPAPVAARTHTCQRIIDVVQGALAQALPQAATGASNGANITAFLSGAKPGSDAPFLNFETYGGAGARADKDGKDGVQCQITNTANTPVEAIESEFPLLVESYGFATDAGGAGRYRGGLALRRVIRPLGEARFARTGERFLSAPWGAFGAQAGASGAFWIERWPNSAPRRPIRSTPSACTGWPRPPSSPTPSATPSSPTPRSPPSPSSGWLRAPMRKNWRRGSARRRCRSQCGRSAATRTMSASSIATATSCR